MADIALSRSFVPAIRLGRPGWLGALAHHAAIRRRRARRNRYLALIGRAPRRYPWFDTMFGAMSGR